MKGKTKIVIALLLPRFIANAKKGARPLQSSEKF